MWVHKWNINHVNNYNIYFDKKENWNTMAMKLINPLKAIDFA
jgi:hypothetical protein